MPSYTIANLQISDKDLRNHFNTAREIYNISNNDDLNYIFEIALQQRDRFPNVNLTGALTPLSYMERWIKGYCDATNNPPSLRIANQKSTCTDPAIRIIVQATQNITDKKALIGENIHNLFMSAENIQGNLLEEYIATKIRPYGFLWCKGNVLRATDFCNTDGSCLLQIKNKSNTENSSSSSIREGTSIEKWFRLGSRTKNGIKVPVYRWTMLNTLINTHKTEGFHLPACEMTEDEYEFFLRQISTSNHNIITNR